MSTPFVVVVAAGALPITMSSVVAAAVVAVRSWASRRAGKRHGAGRLGVVDPGGEGEASGAENRRGQ